MRGRKGSKLTKPSVTIEKIELQGFRAYLRPQTFKLALGKRPLSLAIFGPNAIGKSSLVDSFEFYWSKDATLERLGKRTFQTNAGPTAIAHVDAQDEGIETSVHFWFNRNGERFDEARSADSLIPEAAGRILSTIKIPFVIRGHELRSFVENTTPGAQYKELVNWFGLESLLSIQQNLRTLRKKVKEKSESTSETVERSRDLLSETDGEVAKWNDQVVCNWLNNGVLASLDSSLKFVEFSKKDPAFAILTAQSKAEQEELGLTRLRKISGLLEDLALPLDRTNGEIKGSIPAFEQAVSRLNQAIFHERAERGRVSAAVFSQVWEEAKKLLDNGEVLEACPICDATLATGHHGSHDGLRVSIDKKLSGLATYRNSEKELKDSKKQVKRATEDLKHGLKSVNLELEDTSYTCAEVGDYFQTLSRWSINEELPPSQDITGALSRVFNSIANQITQIESQQGEHTYGKALDTVNKLLSIQADLQRIARTKARLKSLQIELARQVLEIDKAIVDYIQSLIGKLESDVASIYQDIQGTGGTSHPIRIEFPGQDGIDQQKAQLLIDFSINRQGVVPSGYLSDSQVHTLALALRLAAIRMFNSEAPILVLDDVVTSYDADHRKTIVGALAKYFSKFQIVLVTHDEQFYNLLKDQLPQGRWVFKRIVEIREDFGPVLHDHLTSDEVIQAKLDAGENAGAEIRQAEEEWLLRICREFGAKVTIRPIERAFQYERAELADSLASFLKGAKIKIPQTATASNSFLASLQRGVVENQASHFSDNPYKSSSVGDDMARWKEFKNFRELFKCPSCEKQRFKRPKELKKPVCNNCQTPFAFFQP